MSKPLIPSIIKKIKNQPPQDIDTKTKKAISYSQFSVFMSCPHKWSLMYKDGHYTSDQSINMSFGTALHETLQHYITTIFEKSGAEADRIDMERYFEDKLCEVYLKDLTNNKNVHFSSPQELREFYEDGIKILDFIKKHRSLYFSKKGWHLIGCEIPVLAIPHPDFPILFKGFIDVVLYNEITNKFLILDIKTSKSGWDDKTKKDDIKQSQLVLYKRFFAEQFDLPLDDIDIEFFIVKRKVWEEAEYAAAKKRVQEFIPASGKIKIKKTSQMIDAFIEEVFEIDGTHKVQTFQPRPSANNCRFCAFRDKPELCSKGLV